MTQIWLRRATHILLGLLYLKKEKFSQNITFGDEDLIVVARPHNDTLAAVGDIADFNVKRVLVDGESTANVLTWDTFWV